MAGRVFSGRLHPAEMAGRMAREADFARFEHDTGPATGNVFTIVLNPRDVIPDATELEAILAAEMTRYTTEEGLRVEGPISIRIRASGDTAAGTVQCHVGVEPGIPETWGRLSSQSEVADIRHNRSLIGRSPQADVNLVPEGISRRHALIWRKGGRIWIRDLGSSNGTTVDGVAVGDEPMAVSPGAVVGFGAHRYRLSVI